MRTRWLLALFLALALFPGWSEAPVRADDEGPGTEAAPPPLEFPSDDLIQRADGTILFFYRTNFVPPAELARRLRDVLVVSGVVLRELEAQNTLLIEGEPCAVELATDAASYFDVAPRLVWVEAQCVEITQTGHEGADDPLEGKTEVLTKSSVFATQGAESTVSRTVERTVLRKQGGGANEIGRSRVVVPANVSLRVLPTYVGDQFVTLRIQLEVRNLREAGGLLSETEDPAQAEWEIDTTVTLKDESTLVIGGLDSNLSTGRRTKAETKTEIVVLLTAKIADCDIPLIPLPSLEAR